LLKQEADDRPADRRSSVSATWQDATIRQDFILTRRLN
jgi:hypothetical protein